jgi:hypothetical protein
MFRRLFVLVLLIVATLSASTPTHASTLRVDYFNCGLSYYDAANGHYWCYANAVGGTGSYVSYSWTISSNWGMTYTMVTSEPSIRRTCGIGEYVYVSVMVTDSAGATAGASGPVVACHGGPID